MHFFLFFDKLFCWAFFPAQFQRHWILIFSWQVLAVMWSDDADSSKELQNAFWIFPTDLYLPQNLDWQIFFMVFVNFECLLFNDITIQYNYFLTSIQMLSASSTFSVTGARWQNIRFADVKDPTAIALFITFSFFVIVRTVVLFN